ncbi:MAG: response regulator transcription factor [Myxococcota bacterium]
MRILVVDDHAETRELVVRHLQRAAYVVSAAACCADARAVLAGSAFDVVVLDVMLPDASGIELCRHLRAEENAVPILLLTARADVRDRVAGLEAGADDYVVKPFALAELTARVRALARRGPVVRAQALRFGSLLVDLAARKVSIDGRNVPLTAREISIVEVLASRRGVVSKDVLLESVWGESNEAAESSLEVLIGRIRRKFGAQGSQLRTVRGLGYVLEAE